MNGDADVDPLEEHAIMIVDEEPEEDYVEEAT